MLCHGARHFIRGKTGPDGQNIFRHTDVLINDFFLWTPILVRFTTINKDNSYFFRNTRLSFDMVLYHLKY